MTERSRTIPACPVCGDALTWDARRVYCPLGHTFDLSREGYANLLLANQRGSNRAGDGKEMVAARRAFLEAGFYAPLSRAICRSVADFLEGEGGGEEIGVLDAGCGEGYYLGELYRHVAERWSRDLCSFYGLDISKEAIRRAARAYPDIRWMVANVARKLPFAAHSFDVCLNIFAPRNTREFHRVIRPGRLLLAVAPGEGHLVELRERTMAYARTFGHKTADAVAAFSPEFRLKAQVWLTYPMMLDREMLGHLIRMTPLYWKASRPAIARVSELDSLEVTASFSVLSFVRAFVLDGTS